MYKYGIDNTVVIHRSEKDISSDLLPAFGAANIEKFTNVDDDENADDENEAGQFALLDRTEVLQKLAANYVQVTFSGALPSVNINTPTQTNFDLVFYNRELGIFLSADSNATIKPPLKPNSSLKQIISSTKSSSFSLNISLKSNVTRRSVKVIESHSKLTACGSIPIHFSCFIDSKSSLNEVFEHGQIGFNKYMRYTKAIAKTLKSSSDSDNTGLSLQICSYFNEKCILPVNILSISPSNTPPTHPELNLKLEKHNLLSDGFQFTPVPELNVISNPHEILKPPNLPIVAYTKRRYGYYHYGQQKMNDSGWGCAYRSLQTLFSWFYLDGRTDKVPPTHEMIQKTLVSIGDKQKDFIGSRQWIGSFEVQFVLNELLGIDCKTINVSSGGELESRIPELIDHFESVGSPIMIGGGVLAHTIVGVAFDDATREGRFCILDPHYTGHHNINGIKDKGVYWKGSDFWNKDAYYNMCLPQL